MDETLKRKLAARAKGQHRPLSEQARRYIELAMIAEDNLDLPFQIIEKILEGTAEVEAGLAEPVEWGRRQVPYTGLAAPGCNKDRERLAPAVIRRLDETQPQILQDPHRGGRSEAAQDGWL